MKKITKQEQVVYDRLTELGISKYNEHKRIIKALADVIAPGEQIISVVIGRNEEHTSALFALTDRRLFHIVGDLIFHSTDEIALSSVVGVALLPTPILSSVTITQAGNNKSVVQDANNSNSQAFVHAMNQTLSGLNSASQPQTPISQATTPKQLTAKEHNFLSSHNIINLTATNSDNTTLTEPVYYVAQENSIYIMTRQHTKKAQDMIAHPDVKLLLISQDQTQTLQIEGEAIIVNEVNKKHEVYEQINQIIANLPAGSSIIQSPLYDLSQGVYTIFKVVIADFNSNF